jgi:hypothetical protein
MFKSMKNHSVVFGAVLFLLAFVLAPTSATADTCVFPPAGMTNWWPADGNAFDIIGGNDGTLQGNAGFTAGMVAKPSISTEPAISSWSQMTRARLSISTDLLRSTRGSF